MCLFINMEGKFTLRIYFLVPLFLYPNFFHIFKRKHINFSIIGDCACTSHSSKCMWFKVLVCYMLLVRKECAIGSPFYTSRWLFFFSCGFIYLFILLFQSSFLAMNQPEIMWINGSVYMFICIYRYSFHIVKYYPRKEQKQSFDT